VTSVGSLKGKIRYMSPEQLRGDVIDRRTDVFALGVMFWEMSTGAPLFRAPNDAAVMHKILFEDISRPTEVVPNYPPVLEEIVMAALAKKADERTSTAEELGRSLAEYAAAARLPRGGLRVYSRQLFGKEIDQALARVEKLQARIPLPRGRAISESEANLSPPDLTPPPPASPLPRSRTVERPALTRPRTVDRPAVVPVMSVRPSAPSIPVPGLAAVSGTVPSNPRTTTRRKRSETRNLILLGLIVLLVVGGGILLSRYTPERTTSSQPR
jgi:serine/threonine protein kinase